MSCLSFCQLVSHLDVRNGEAIALDYGCTPPVCRTEEADLFFTRELAQQGININV